MLFDAVGLLVSDEGAKALLSEPAIRDFVADAWAHMKFIGRSKAASVLSEKAGLGKDLDAGCVELEKPDAAAAFIKTCGKQRYWQRGKTSKLG